jgi:hypothetical protein
LAISRKTFLCLALNHQTGKFQTRNFIVKCHFSYGNSGGGEMKDLIKQSFKLGIESVKYFDSACARIDNDHKTETGRRAREMSIKKRLRSLFDPFDRACFWAFLAGIILALVLAWPVELCLIAAGVAIIVSLYLVSGKRNVESVYLVTFMFSILLACGCGLVIGDAVSLVIKPEFWQWLGGFFPLLKLI